MLSIPRGKQRKARHYISRGGKAKDAAERVLGRGISGRGQGEM